MEKPGIRSGTLTLSLLWVPVVEANGSSSGDSFGGKEYDGFATQNPSNDATKVVGNSFRSLSFGGSYLQGSIVGFLEVECCLS